MNRIERATFFVVSSPRGWYCEHKHETYELAKKCYNRQRQSGANKYEHLWIEQIDVVQTHTKLFEDHGDPAARFEERYNLDDLDKKPIEALTKLLLASPEYQSIPEVKLQMTAGAKKLSQQSHKTKRTICIVCSKIFVGDKRSYYCKKNKCRNDARYWSEKKKRMALTERDNKLNAMQESTTNSTLITENNLTLSDQPSLGEMLRQKARPPVEITCRFCGTKEFRDKKAQICTGEECQRKADQERKQRQRKKNIPTQ